MIWSNMEKKGFILHSLRKVANVYGFTHREIELLSLLMLYGYRNKELAKELTISEKTVKNHLANIQEKTMTNSTRELMSLLIQYLLRADERNFTNTLGTRTTDVARLG